jgi:cystathionine gamma-synthase
VRYPGLASHPQHQRRACYPAERGIVPDDLLRVSVGVEHVEDLWEDVQHALTSTADVPGDA